MEKSIAGPGGRRRQESERRRLRILEAARACFGEHGYGGATVEAIAARAGVSNGLLYQFFRNKQHLFQVVIEDLVRDWVRVMVPRGNPDEPAATTLDGMFLRSVEFCRSHPLLVALLSVDGSLELGRFSDMGERVDAHRELVAGILRRGVGSGELRSDLDVRGAADVICQLQADYSSRAYRRDLKYPADPQLIETAVRFVRDAVRAR